MKTVSVYNVTKCAEGGFIPTWN